MSLLEHAKQELKLLGYKPLDEEQDDGRNKWMQENVLELLEVFSRQGHSVGSAYCCIGMFEKLAKLETLSYITGKDDEWIDLGGYYQNRRLSSLFKDSKSATPYYIDAIAWKDEDGLSFTGSAFNNEGKKICSRQFIRLPFMPKKFYIDVFKKESANGEVDYFIKDESQLIPVIGYYDFRFS